MKLSKGIDFATAPRLLGFVVTKPKPTAEMLLTESWTDDPLLARWQYGLGKSVIFTSDVEGAMGHRMAAAWSGYPKFWSQLVRETMRRPGDEYFDFKVTRDGDSALVSLNAVDKDGHFRNELHPQVRVIGPDQKPSSVDLPAGGTRCVRIPYSHGQGRHLRVSCGGSEGPAWNGQGAGVTHTILEYSYPAEYHFLSARHSETAIDQQRNGREISAGAGRNL